MKVRIAGVMSSLCLSLFNAVTFYLLLSSAILTIQLNFVDLRTKILPFENWSPR